MSTKKTPKDEVELALKVLHQQINTLKQKVEELCESTEGCGIPKSDAETPKDSQGK